QMPRFLLICQGHRYGYSAVKNIHPPLSEKNINNPKKKKIRTLNAYKTVDSFTNFKNFKNFKFTARFILNKKGVNDTQNESPTTINFFRGQYTGFLEVDRFN
ncbi:Hypothetical predicted protein, partial [Mytilus galloprovincialis]